MSRVPTGTLALSMRVMILPSRSASGTPRRRIPTSPRLSTPSFFSTISYASRTSVRSISDGDMSCAFWRRPVLREGVFAFMSGCASAALRPATQCSQPASRGQAPLETAPLTEVHLEKRFRFGLAHSEQLRIRTRPPVSQLRLLQPHDRLLEQCRVPGTQSLWFAQVEDFLGTLTRGQPPQDFDRRLPSPRSPLRDFCRKPWPDTKPRPPAQSTPRHKWPHTRPGSRDRPTSPPSKSSAP